MINWIHEALQTPVPALVGLFLMCILYHLRSRELNKAEAKNKELTDTVDQLREAIEEHRAQKADDRCWMDDQRLYAVLNDGNLGDNRVGDKAAMMINCARFIENRCVGGTWKTYEQLETEKSDLEYRMALAMSRIAEIIKENKT